MADTIFAEATARGRAGVAVIRISGCQAFEIARVVAGPLPPPRQAALRELKDARGEVLDTALVIAFAGPGSFTGEDVVELHCHGSMAVLAAVMGALGACAGARLAEPGEFTRRALQNGKLDLAQVEGLSDLLAAETEMQRRLAQRVAHGALGALAEEWRGALLQAAALITAAIDFSDEEIPDDLLGQAAGILRGVIGALERECAGVAVAERIRDGFTVVILGRPNVGKSSLLNRLAGREVAITSSLAGTTRDVIEVRLDLGGLPVTMLDTAGLRESADQVEEIGVARALARAEDADLRLVLIDESGAPEGLALRPDDIVLRTKCDMVAGADISARTGAGLDRLLERMTQVLAQRAAGAETATRARHKVAMERALGLLHEAQSRLEEGTERCEFAAEDVRGALLALDSLIGRVDVESVLDEIFSRFCLGK